MSFEQQKNELVKVCKNLLDNGKVKLIIGFTAGEEGGSSVPFFIRDTDDLEGVTWDSTCTASLAKYLTEKKEDVAIIAKPCDARAIVMYLVENQIDRNKIYIIGMECPGMSNKDGTPVSACSECTLRVPPIYDVLVKNGNASAETVLKTDNNDQRGTDKLARFKGEMKKCILCFSCRQACYGCYCETCFVERGIPNWLPSDVNVGSKMVFHLGRAMHLAGRCVGCGACENACPSGVNIRYLVKDLADFCKELYGYEPGTDPDELPAMTAFDFNDKEVGFLGGEDNESCCGTKKPD